MSPSGVTRRQVSEESPRRLGHSRLPESWIADIERGSQRRINKERRRQQHDEHRVDTDDPAHHRWRWCSALFETAANPASSIRGQHNESKATGQGRDISPPGFFSVPRGTRRILGCIAPLPLARDGRLLCLSHLAVAVPELREGRATAGSTVVETPMPKLIRPHPSANAIIPAHRGTETWVGMGQQSEERPWPKLHDGLNQLHPKEHAP